MTFRAADGQAEETLRRNPVESCQNPGRLELVQVELLPPQEKVQSKGWWQSVVDWWVELASFDVSEPVTERSSIQDGKKKESRR